MAFTVTKDLTLPATVTGSWPRPRWFDTSMWGRPLDTCMLDVRFREKFQDALATILSDQDRAFIDRGRSHLPQCPSANAYRSSPE